MTKVKTVPVVP